MMPLAWSKLISIWSSCVACAIHRMRSACWRSASAAVQPTRVSGCRQEGLSLSAKPARPEEAHRYLKAKDYSHWSLIECVHPVSSCSAGAKQASTGAVLPRLARKRWRAPRGDGRSAAAHRGEDLWEETVSCPLVWSPESGLRSLYDWKKKELGPSRPDSGDQTTGQLRRA